MEERLQEKLLEIQALLDEANIPELVIIYREDGTIAYYNSFAYQDTNNHLDNYI